MKKKNLALSNTMDIILSNEELENDINIPVIQKVKEEPKKSQVAKPKSVVGPKRDASNTTDLSDSITLLLYSDLKFRIDQHVINYDIKYNTFYSNVITHFYNMDTVPTFERIDEDKETIKVRIVCNKEDKKNIRLFVKEQKITLREFFTAYIEHYLNKQ